MSQPYSVTCDPPLGHTAVIDEVAGVYFTVVLQWKDPPIERNWKAAIWHSGNSDRTWTEYRLECAASDIEQVIKSRTHYATKIT